jgi:hypothetical protein
VWENPTDLKRNRINVSREFNALSGVFKGNDADFAYCFYELAPFVTIAEDAANIADNQTVQGKG